MTRGPVDVIVIEFPVGRSAHEALVALREMAESPLLHVIDLVLATREQPDDELVLVDAEGDLPDELSWLGLEPHALLNDADLALVSESLPSDSQAAILAVEHVWARDAMARVAGAGGQVALYARVSPFEAEIAFAALGR